MLKITRKANALIDWLEGHRMVNAALVLAYVGFILFGHDIFVRVSVTVMNALSLPVYNLVIGAVTVIIGLGFIGFLVFFLGKGNFQRKRKSAFLAVLMLLLVAHHFVLFEMNIEVIHAGLYAGLAVLLFPFGRRFGAPLVYALPIMFLDEWHQYRILYPDYVEYLELNDMVIDLLGSALMLCGMWVIGVRDRPAHRSFFLRKEGMLFMAMAVVAAMLLATGLLVPFLDDATERTLLVMSRLPDPQGFWSVHAFTGRTYHVLQPITGLVVIAVLVLLGQGMGTRPEST